KMAQDQECSVMDLIQDETRRQKIVLADYVTDNCGLPTLRDIMAELAKPGRDPREQFENVVFAEGIEKPEDLIPGMKLDGVVTNITAFGAFVDIGVHQDGLVHISEMADRFVKSPGDVVKVSQKVEVTVLAVDAERKRISLSMKKLPKDKTDTERNDRPDASNAGERKIQKGKPPRRDEKKREHGKKSTKPFNNPFADALRRSKRGLE
ncbi:MAG: S1 RNA-binding domain-containing protein, partial [Thermodesulfobacteriota bacterium]|nr:S1 RNA-binding domain-containing protein [Thermodesulfobacteriota bacterium]